MSVGCSLPVRRLQLVSTGKDRSPLASLELFLPVRSWIGGLAVVLDETLVLFISFVMFKRTPVVDFEENIPHHLGPIGTE
jgi:hypothetical protein